MKGISKYTYSFVEVDERNLAWEMRRLEIEGWKNLRFRNWGEFNSYIEGDKPRSAAELKKVERQIISEKKQKEKKELNQLKKLAKKYNYKLVEEK